MEYFKFLNPLNRSPFLVDKMPVIIKPADVMKNSFNPLMPELNLSAQRCLARFLMGILVLEPCISLIYA
jgi:hypothetical protein